MKKSLFIIQNRKTTVFLICLGISAFFWLLIKLSAEYEINVEIPVAYSNFPTGQTLVNHPDSNIHIRIRDHGFDLLGTRLFSFRNQVELDISKMRIIRINAHHYHSYILSKDLYARILNRFKSAQKIDIISPDSLVFQFEKKATKRVKIYSKSNIQLAPQFQLKKDVAFSPDSCHIYGSSKDLESIDSIFTETIVLDQVSTPLSRTLKLNIPKQVQCDCESTSIEIDVEKFTEATLHIPIDLSFARHQNIKVFPNQVAIKYAVSFEKFNEIKASAFLVTAKEDTNDLGKLDFLLQKHPEDIRIIDYSPKVGEFIILK